MRSSQNHRGFTLIEVMISVAFALVLMLGVNQVFKATTDTIGVGQSFIKANADARTIEATLANDMAGIDQVYTASTPVGDGPCFIIMSQHEYAFRDNVDYQRATDQSRPYYDTNLFGNSTLFPTGNECPVPFIHFRSHRVDRLGMFVRGLFPRQTASSDLTFISSTASSEAWSFYGHAVQPNNSAIAGSAPPTNGAGWIAPGTASTGSVKNDNNFFSSDWLLARQLMLLVPNPNVNTDPNYYPTGSTLLSPLAYTTQSTVPGTTGSLPVAYTVDTCRLDIAQTSIAKFYNLVSAVSSTAWWLPLMNYRPQASAILIADPTVTATATSPKITSYAMAKTSPALVRGCSQFVVEYSGNFYTKDQSGGFLAAAPDPTGANDFYIDSNQIRRTRWYGFPRAVNSINSYNGTTPSLSAVSPVSGDVVPLRDVNPAVINDAERFSSGALPSGCTALPSSGYWAGMDPATDYNAPYTYVAAWGPGTKQPFPKMIRIVIGIDDRNGNLKNSQLSEYVYDVLP